jgi:hypothetical protein
VEILQGVGTLEQCVEVTHCRALTDRSYWLPEIALPTAARFPIITRERWGPHATEEAA